MWLVVDGLSQHGVLALGLPLNDGAITIGRHEDCDILLSERDVSRKHLLIRRKGDEITFDDLDSLSGTFLNGRNCTKGTFKPGDILRVGHTEFRLQADFPFASVDKIITPGLAKSSSNTVDWRPFRSFFRKLREPGDPREIVERLLLGLVEILGAQRGFVLLSQGSGSELTNVASYHLENSESFLAVSSTVYEQVFENEETCFIADTSVDPITSNAPSLEYECGARTVLCGPLAAGSQVFGVIYIDGAADGSALCENNIPLFEMLTEMASELLQASDMRRQLLASRGRIVAFQSLAGHDSGFILGESSVAKELERLVEAAAPKDVSVLLTGETGTGKEMVARAIHDLSSRRGQPFVPVNCAAFPSDIIEAELFGAEKGAYTGALERRIGRFELASSGTLFLDEVGDLPLEIQLKLLRVLQEKTITRLGGNEAIPVSFRLICATNASLEDCVKAGTFRQDFYFRINVFPIHLKPLRERLEDILIFAHHFLEEYGTSFGKNIGGFSEESKRLLLSYSWPGNIRELRNAMERAIVLESQKLIQADNLPIHSSLVSAEMTFLEHLPKNYEDARSLFEKLFIKRSYVLNNGNVSAVARDTGIPRNTLYRRLTKYGFHVKGR